MDLEQLEAVMVCLGHTPTIRGATAWCDRCTLQVIRHAPRALVLSRNAITTVMFGVQTIPPCDKAWVIANIN